MQYGLKVRSGIGRIPPSERVPQQEDLIRRARYDVDSVAAGGAGVSGGNDSWQAGVTWSVGARRWYSTLMVQLAGFVSVRDLYAKLDRDAASLDQQVTSDGFFNFVVTGYSMIDWIRNDPSVPASAKAQAAVQGLHADQWLKVCGDLATAAKHFTLTRRKPVASSATSSRGFGAGRFERGGWGSGEEGIEVTLSNGTSFHGLDLVRGVLATWQRFFAAHGI